MALLYHRHRLHRHQLFFDVAVAVVVVASQILNDKRDRIEWLRKSNKIRREQLKWPWRLREAT